MSLLLDARKKSQQVPTAQEKEWVQHTSALDQAYKSGAMYTPDESDPHRARNAGQNLFNAKLQTPQSFHPLSDRNVLFVLGGTILLLGIGAIYLWSIEPTSSTQQQHPAIRPAAAPISQQPVLATAVQQTNLVHGIAAQKPAAPEPPAPMAKLPGATTDGMSNAFTATPRAPAKEASPPAPPLRDKSPTNQNQPVRIEQHKAEPVDPLLSNAYLAYRSGKLDKAQQLYLAMLKKDAQNPDALLGLASIAQHHGENRAAVQYYARVLALDPRNALANAGMSALSKDDERNESRLKNLLREQGSSAALHFALGNLYAGQSRWSEAQQVYFNACTLEPDNAEFAFNLAVSLDHLGQRKLAVQYYQRALALDQQHAAGFDHAQISLRIQDLMR